MNKTMKPISKSEGMIYWVNSAKGIGVILVVLGHLLYGSTIEFLNQYIYSFHMPLFFILSGFVQKETIRENYIEKRSKKLLAPFLRRSFPGGSYIVFQIILISLIFLELTERSSVLDSIYRD